MNTILLSVYFLTTFLSPQSAPQKAEALEVHDFERTRHRTSFFGKDPKRPSPAQVSIEFGRQKWSADEAGKTKDGRRAVGIDYWTTFDTNSDLDIGGRKVRAGQYYVVVEEKKGKLKCVFLPSAKIRRDRMSIMQAAATRGGVSVPLDREPVQGVPRHFALTTRPDNPKVKKSSKLRLLLAWGEFTYTAKIKVKKANGAMQVQQSEARNRSVLTRGVAPDAPCITVEHGMPKWNGNRGTSIDDMKPGSRWRLGQNFWSSIETNTAFTIGGAKVTPGVYFLVLERGATAAWKLVLVPAGEIRKKTMDGFQSSQVKGGIVVPLTTEPALSKKTSKLGIRFEKNQDAAALHIRWGPYHLSAPVKL